MSSVPQTAAALSISCNVIGKSAIVLFPFGFCGLNCSVSWIPTQVAFFSYFIWTYDFNPRLPADMLDHYRSTDCPDIGKLYSPEQLILDLNIWLPTLQEAALESESGMLIRFSSTVMEAAQWLFSVVSQPGGHWFPTPSTQIVFTWSLFSSCAFVSTASQTKTYLCQFSQV